MSGPARKLVALLAEHPDGLTINELAEHSRARFPGLAAARVAQLVEQALAAGAILSSGGRLRAVAAGDLVGDTVPRAQRTGPLRGVVVDLESVVRTTAVEPFTDKRIFQLGATRVGADNAWVAAAPRFSAWVALPDDEWVITSGRIRDAHAAAAVPPQEALALLLAYAGDADVVVAYNGTEADFPLLGEACDREGLPRLGGEYVDAYYLALAVWPNAPSHRLAFLAEQVGVRTSDLRWHDAAEDCVLLGRVLDAAAAAVAGWPADRVALVASVVPDSPAWRLLRELAGGGTAVGTPRAHSHADVAAVAAAGLVAHPPRRASAGALPGRGPVPVGASLRGSDGRVDPVALAAAAHGGAANRRAAQEQMTSAMHGWADDGHGGLVEAPTGTGKSLAVLAVALDWLAGDPNRTAVVSTYTKQLQAQLAHDVAALQTAVPGLLQAADVVKGASNRLSLRALLVALADATSLDGTRRGRQGSHNRFVERLGFRELCTYLLLRLLAATDREASWAAHSVDLVDVPAFFTGYAGSALGVWLESLSQGANGEYDAAVAQPIAAHTNSVGEALAAHRLILANHALLLAHLDDLAGLGDNTLLVVDEAHQLEDAATSALTTALDYRSVEDLFGELRGWVADHGGVAEARPVEDAVRNLGFLLDHEQLPKTAGLAFDARSAGVGVLVGSRTVTLVSPYAGTAGVGQVRGLTGLLTRLAGLSRAIVGALGAYLAAHGATMNFFDVERLRALIARTAAADAAATAIVDDIDAVLGPPPWRQAAASGASPGDPPAAGDRARPPATAGDGGTGDADRAPASAGEGGAAGDVASGDSDATDDDTGADVVVDDDDADPSDEDMQDGDDDRDDDPVGSPDAGAAAAVAVPLTNRVVYAEEIEALRAGLRSYRFRIASAPIELPADLTWQQFLATFARTFYVSATLRVAGEWTFLRDRLGLHARVATLALNSPFDIANQAELVCFADFPSWAEQADGAMRTVAHQLSRYATEMIRPVPVSEEPQPGERGGFDGGAMVLTTARSSAGGIADYLADGLRRAGDDTPVRSALVLGNPRAVGAFTDRESGGGLLVGTKGLWQGVDVGDPDRLRLVWINKLPFAPFAAPVIEARRAAVALRAEQTGAEDPDAVATETYYLPLAALQLRQAVGRLIRSERHRGVIVISDRKLAGATALRRAYRRTFLSSLDPGLLRDDLDTGEPAGGNVVPMTEGWRRIWAFYARHGLLDAERAAQLSTDAALDEHTLLPQTRRISELALTDAQTAELAASRELADEVVRRAAEVGGLLHLSETPAQLKDSQREVIRAVADGRNVLGLLPTGFGKSFCFQLPALVLPGVTLVVSPLVALMHDQALELNRSIGGAVRALVAPLRESSSRAGKTEVADQLLGRADHGIRLVYVSPERLCQTRFREVVRAAVAAGRVRRIALDEAHTFVQWGDDFRPSFRRVEQFLGELRAEFGLPVTALTATANRTVHAGLRENVFGLAGEVPDGGDGEQLVTVTENPIRPELAIFRRSVNAAGPAIVAGLAEEVLDAVDDHAIFYCLTVKEVVALHAHLREYLGEAGVRVRRFHGRLTEAEKAAVMNEFRDAPRKGEEGFAPLVVVATSAFGLGINRPDIRTVFCVSPPTDLAALYQQLGRAGRDAAGKAVAGATDPATDGPDGAGGTVGTGGTGPTDGTAGAGAADGTGSAGTALSRTGETGTGETAGPAGRGAGGAPANTGLALFTSRGLRTVAWMTGQDLPMPLLVRMGEAVLRCKVLDAADVADTLVAADLASGRLSADEARPRRTAEAYTAGVVRAFAALAGLGAVTDLGDFPPVVAVKAGELLGRGAGDETEVAVVTALLALPSRPGVPGELARARLNVARADAHLAAVVPGYRKLAGDPAATWRLLADLHDRGQLDVSAAPSRRLVTGVAVHTRTMPGGFVAALAGKAARAAAEVALLRDFFADRGTCANRKFADYFGVPDVPDGCCTTAANRCSACWDFRTDWPATDVQPATARALLTNRPRPAGWRVDAAAKARRLDEQVRMLVWTVDRGLSARDVHLALRGQDSWFLAKARRRVRLPNAVTTSRFFGANPSVALPAVEDSLARLAADGRVVAAGRRWRDADNIAREARRLARQAAAAGAGAP
jgi:RecQ family ATP-dependent DNA helicase